jgi:hypothetical protein
MSPMRKPGRPPLDDQDPSKSVHVKLTASLYDETYVRARTARVSVPELIRRDVADGSRTPRARHKDEPS